MFRSCFVFDHGYFSAAGSLTTAGTGKVSNPEMSRGCLEAQYETANAALETLSQRQLGILKYLEHLSIDLEHERDELSNTPASRQANELIQEQRGRAAMLILVRNCDSHLSAVPARRHADEARDSYQSFAVFFSNRQHESDVISEIELGQASEGVGCKRRNRAKEPPIDALSG
jgi:hypothetical protein